MKANQLSAPARGTGLSAGPRTIRQAGGRGERCSPGGPPAYQAVADAQCSRSAISPSPFPGRGGCISPNPAARRGCTRAARRAPARDGGSTGPEGRGCTEGARAGLGGRKLWRPPRRPRHPCPGTSRRSPPSSPGKFEPWCLPSVPQAAGSDDTGSVFEGFGSWDDLAHETPPRRRQGPRPGKIQRTSPEAKSHSKDLNERNRGAGDMPFTKLTR